MYKVFKGFAQVATCNTLDEVKQTLATLTGGAVNVLKKKKAIYSAYHFQAGEVQHGWA